MVMSKVNGEPPVIHDQDRHYRILRRVILGLKPLTDETPEEGKTRAELEKEVDEIHARGGFPTILLA